MPPSPLNDPRAFLRSLFDAAVAAAQPANGLAAHLPAPPRGRTVVVGAGKASAAMAAALDAAWPPDAALGGLVVTRRGHIPPGFGGRIEAVEAGHPMPDEAGRDAAQRIVQAVQGLSRDDLVIALISGGGSALLALPHDGITLADKQAVTRALLHSGATIAEINTVRKHLSAVKGGRLGALCAPAQVLTLLISDVPGDAPDMIASGPTLPDASTCAGALAVLRRHGIEAPAPVLEGLANGRFETPKPGDPRFATHRTALIATPTQSLQAAAARAEAQGVEARVLGDAIEGEARELGRTHAQMARALVEQGRLHRPLVLISGGETTVTVTNAQGRGGRATEYLLGCALELKGLPGVHALAGDTDGIDGSETNAGAFVSPETLARAEARGCDAREALSQNNAYGFFEVLGDLLVTGPTFTNVNDFRALLVMPP
jgi:hydroxypyruvate reductase